MTSDSTPAFEIEKEALKTEIETGIQAGVDHLYYFQIKHFK